MRGVASVDGGGWGGGVLGLLMDAVVGKATPWSYLLAVCDRGVHRMSEINVELVRAGATVHVSIRGGEIGRGNNVHLSKEERAEGKK